MGLFAVCIAALLASGLTLFLDSGLVNQNWGRILLYESRHDRSNLTAQPCHIECAEVPCETQWSVGFDPETRIERQSPHGSRISTPW